MNEYRLFLSKKIEDHSCNKRV